MNLPNKLTIFRIILVPIMVIIPFLGITGTISGIPISWIIIDLIFILASITDKLDGYLARKNNQITTFGKFLDPLADKILVLAAMTMLVEMTKLPAWIPIIVLTREFMVSGYRLVAVEKGGKVCTVSFPVFFSFAVLSVSRFLLSYVFFKIFPFLSMVFVRLLLQS